MAQAAAMAGAKANTSNSAVKAQLQMQNNNNNNSNSNNASQQPSSNKNAAAPVNNAVSNHTSAHAMDTAGSLATTTTMKANGTTPVGNENAATTTTGLKHDSGLATDWSPEEQSILDDALTKHAALSSPLIKYIKIAALLSEKTVRDVAFRIRYMTKENGKRRKDEVQNGTKKTKDKKDKAETTLKQMPATNIAARPHMPMYSPPPAIDNDDGISNDAIGGTAGQLLEQNTQFIARIRSNLANMKLQENTDLLFRMRDNITTILNGMTNLPGILSHMPQLPVELNTELADSILPKSTLQFQS